MRTKLYKFLMNEADGSPGGGAVPPAVPPAPIAAPEAPKYVTSEQLADQLAAFQNGFFANARKAGLLKDSKAEAPTTPAPSTPAASSPTGLSMADVESLLERERVITARATKHGLSDAQTKRMKSALGAVPVDSFATEADAYLSDMGLVRAPTPAAPAAITATQAQEAPKIPAMAPSAPSGHGLPTQGGVVDLFSLTQEQLKALGPKGVRESLEKLSAIGNQLAGIPQRPKPPSQR